MSRLRNQSFCYAAIRELNHVPSRSGPSLISAWPFTFSLRIPVDKVVFIIPHIIPHNEMLFYCHSLLPLNRLGQ